MAFKCHLWNTKNIFCIVIIITRIYFSVISDFLNVYPFFIDVKNKINKTLKVSCKLVFEKFCDKRNSDCTFYQASKL